MTDLGKKKIFEVIYRYDEEGSGSYDWKEKKIDMDGQEMSALENRMEYEQDTESLTPEEIKEDSYV